MLSSVRDVIIPIGGTRPPPPENQCNLCKRIIPPPKLTRCPRCKKLYCKTCITEDLRQGEYVVCLNCARRYVAPKPAFKGKYMPLTLYLSNKARWTRWVRLQFSQVEGILGNDLPTSAHKDPEWWTKSNSVHAKAWKRIGWSVKEVNLEDKTVTFTRPNVLTPEKESNPKKTAPLVKLPSYKRRKKKRPSLTRIAIAQARFQNISRRKASTKKHRGKFRPKSAYEKRLWKTDEKP